MKNKRLLVMLLIFLSIILLGTKKCSAKLELNDLVFDAQINTDGSMKVTERWNINISNTNTLFKTFKIDNTKYSEITDVTVKDLSSQKELNKIYQEMYHVNKDSYYALINSKGLFEIAWGVGLDNSSATKTYEITYKVKDAIAKYNDYAELYWQFLGNDFEIPAKKINGTIILPYNAESTNDIKVWGHTADLNGEIYVTDLNEIKFDINKYSGKKYVEIRTLFPNFMISSNNRIYNREILNSVIEEETLWAEQANARRVRAKIPVIILFVFAAILILVIIIKTIKNFIKLIKLDKKFTPITKLDYYRELPYIDATPAEAIFVYTEGSNNNFLASFSANILDLCLKKYLNLEVEKKTSVLTSDEVKITLLDKFTDELKEDQKITLDFLYEVAKEKKEITTKNINEYLTKHSSKIKELDEKMQKYLDNFEETRGIFDCEKQKEYQKKSEIAVVYLVLGFMFLMLPFIAVLLFLNFVINARIARKINKLTQEGIDEKEKWKAFKKYMENFSLLKEREVPELVLWEKYLVFATVFGISDKVLKQLKIVYPEISEFNSTFYSSSFINMMNSVNVGNCINTSVYSAVSSSGSGSGGGFSGGGGGGRRPEEAEAVAN